MKHCIDTQKAMDQAYSLAQDHAWNGEEKLYQRRMEQYRYYKTLHDNGILYMPNF